MMGGVFTDALWTATVWATVPLVLAAIGGMFTQHANVLNIALEGMMLIGAFAGIAAGGATHSIVLALLAAVGAAVVFSVIFGFVSLMWRADFIVVGIGIGTLALGVSVFLLTIFYHNQSNYTPIPFPSIWKIHLGPLAHIPVFGPALEGQTILVAFTILLVPLSSWVVYRTKYGIHLRSVGQHLDAAVAAGINPTWMKMSAVLISGVLCGLGGAQLSMATLDSFSNNMTAGAGFVALAAIFVGNVKPSGTALSCLAFGFIMALGGQLQQVAGLPSNLMLTLPYGVTVLALLIRPGYKMIARRRGRRRSGADGGSIADAAGSIQLAVGN